MLKPMKLQSLMENEAFIEGLDQMNQDLDEAMEESKKRHRLVMETITGITLSISAGFVSWMASNTFSVTGSFLITDAFINEPVTH